jgi:transcriptional regulator with GAF, ATPase, and Fis domain
MAPIKKADQIKSQATKTHFTAIINKKKLTVASDDKTTAMLKKEIAAYNLKNTEARMKKIMTLLTPKEQKAKTELLVAKKKIKNETKSLKKEIKEIAQSSESLLALEGTVKTLTDEKATLLEENAKLKASLEKAQAVRQETPVVAQRRTSGEY